MWHAQAVRGRGRWWRTARAGRRAAGAARARAAAAWRRARARPAPATATTTIPHLLYVLSFLFVSNFFLCNNFCLQKSYHISLKPVVASMSLIPTRENKIFINNKYFFALFILNNYSKTKIISRFQALCRRCRCHSRRRRRRAARTATRASTAATRRCTTSPSAAANAGSTSARSASVLYVLHITCH